MQSCHGPRGAPDAQTHCMKMDGDLDRALMRPFLDAGGVSLEGHRGHGVPIRQPAGEREGGPRRRHGCHQQAVQHEDPIGRRRQRSWSRSCAEPSCGGSSLAKAGRRACMAMHVNSSHPSAMQIAGQQVFLCTEFRLPARQGKCCQLSKCVSWTFVVALLLEEQMFAGLHVRSRLLYRTAACSLSACQNDSCEEIFSGSPMCNIFKRTGAL